MSECECVCVWQVASGKLKFTQVKFVASRTTSAQRALSSWFHFRLAAQVSWQCVKQKVKMEVEVAKNRLKIYGLSEIKVKWNVYFIYCTSVMK